MLAPMIRFALRRFYVALIGMLLLSLPLFALIRVPLHNKTICDLNPMIDFCRSSSMVLSRNGPLYAIWQTGLPPNDYWPIAVALLAAEGAAQLVLSRRKA